MMHIEGFHRRLDWLLPDWLENVEAYSQAVNEDIISVLYTLLVNSSILLVCVLSFSVLRRYNDTVFSPKAKICPDRTPPKIRNDDGLFQWIYNLYAISDQVVIDKAGYDILFLLRFYRLGFKILLWSSIYCWLVLIPINRNGNNDTPLASFDRWSMTNIPQNSASCWFHLVGIYMFSGVTIYFLEREFVLYAKHRHDYLRQTKAHLRTVLVEGIPHKLRSTHTLATYFDALYPDAVLHVKLAQNLKHLEGLVEQREVVVGLLERALYEDHLGSRRPTVQVGNMLEGVDAIRHHSQQLDNLNISIKKEQRAARILASFPTRRAGPGTAASNSRVINELLRVTEIPKHGFKDSKTIGSSAVAAAAGQKRSLKGTAGVSFLDEEVYSSSYQRAAQVEQRREGPDGLELQCEETNSHTSSVEMDHNYSSFKMTYSQWLWAVWTSPSVMQAWRRIRLGRDGEQFESFAEESASLISSPEERRMYLSKAFVTFRTFTAATVARQVVHMQLAGRMAVVEAPEPSDVVWGNLYTSRKGTLARRFAVELAVLFLIVVWIAPVTLLSFIFSVDGLSEYFPWVAAGCARSPLFLSMVKMLQPLVLVGIMNLLPPILTFLATVEGCTSFSVNQMRSFHRYFTFQILNVFLVTTIAGSVVTVVAQLSKSPAAAFPLLGSSLPKMGGFFTNFILVKAMTGLGTELVRLPQIFSAALKQLFTSNVTPRERASAPLFGGVRNLSNPGWFPFAKIYAQDMLLFVLAATYACISPVILAAGMLYFAGASLVYKHQMLFVYEPIFETGGKWWPMMARCFVVALLFAQSTMLGMMVLKEALRPVYPLVLLIGLTSSYCWYVASIYEPLASQLPLDMATAMDQELSSVAAEEQEQCGAADDYLQPAIRAPEEKPIVEFSLDEKRDFSDI